MTNNLVIGGLGYIGSRLSDFIDCEVVDIGWFGNPKNVEFREVNYGSLRDSYLEKFDNIILLAGHSSVPMSVTDPLGAIENNIGNFCSLLNRMSPDARLIYMSSSSVYSGTMDATEDSEIHTTNIYDYTKKTIDDIATQSGLNTIGIRAGTVNGCSPNFRRDLMVNKMVYDAITTGVITIANEGLYRPILSIDHLCQAIKSMTEGEVPRGIYNLSSCDYAIGEMGRGVSSILNAKIEYLGDTGTYDFTIDCSKIRSFIDIPSIAVYDIIDDMIANQEDWGNERLSGKRLL